MLNTNLKAFGKKGFKALGKDEKGFTLIELLAVIVILGIIAVIAVPLIGNIINNSRTNADLNTASQIYGAARMYVIGEQNGDFINAGSVTVKTLMDKGYLDKNLILPSSKAVIADTAKVTFNATTGQLDSITLNPDARGSANGVYTATQVLSVSK